PPTSALCPYTTLFRSDDLAAGADAGPSGVPALHLAGGREGVGLRCRGVLAAQRGHLDLVGLADAEPGDLRLRAVDVLDGGLEVLARGAGGDGVALRLRHLGPLDRRRGVLAVDVAGERGGDLWSHERQHEAGEGRGVGAERHVLAVT